MQRIGWWLLSLGIASGLLPIAGGCRRNATTPVAVQPVAAAPTEEAAAPPAVEIETTPPTAEVEPEDKAPEIVEAAPAPPISKERILLLAPDNPIIVEIQLSIDGQPHTEALARLVDEVLKIGDTDGDGRTMWKELCACKRIKYGQYGNLAIDSENSEKQVIDRYDIARDGIVDRSELPRFLTRNGGGSRPFSSRGALNHRDLNRRGAATWRVIDADDDGVISASERDAAAALLASRDNDDDEALVASDLNPRLQALDPEMMAERRRRGPDAARLLGSHADWSAVLTSLEQEYGGGRILRSDSFPLTPELFGLLDKNKDGRIRRDEIAALNDVPAHVVVAAEFGRVQGQESRVQEEGDQEKAAEKARGPR